MFETIIDDPVLIRRDEAEIEIPYISAISTASHIWKMAEWIYSEFKKDCRVSIFDGEGLPLSMKKFQGFTFRNTSRTISYVIHIWNIEKILMQTFKELEDVFSDLKLVISQDIKDEKLQRELEVKKIKYFRNKVAAHSSWAKRDEKDSNADREASLACWSGNFGIRGRSPRNFIVGSCHQNIQGKSPKHSHYSISIYIERKKMILHFQAWERLLINMMNVLEANLPSNLKNKSVS